MLLSKHYTQPNIPVRILAPSLSVHPCVQDSQMLLVCACEVFGSATALGPSNLSLDHLILLRVTLESSLK